MGVSDDHQVVYGADRDGLVFAVVTGTQYPSRIAISMLQELYPQFTEQYGNASRTAKENALSKKSKPILKAACAKYEDPASVDKTRRVMDQVDLVKGQMQENIADMLQNQETAEEMAMKSDQLVDQASVFKKRSAELKNQMKWKNVKMTIIFVVFLICVILAITLPLVNRAKKLA